jgi:hypothetical protein
MNDHVNETNSCLKDNPGLLCVNRHRSKFPGNTHEMPENFAQLVRFTGEVVLDSVVSAGVRKILCDKTMTTLRTFPLRFLRSQF